jgi:hypothetical protein
MRFVVTKYCHRTYQWLFAFSSLLYEQRPKLRTQELQEREIPLKIMNKRWNHFFGIILIRYIHIQHKPNTTPTMSAVGVSLMF